nr:sugar phosphate isomerase/epimerase [bacterium]
MAPIALGLQTYTIRDITQTEKDMREAFRQAAACGYDCIQVGCEGSDIPKAAVADALKENGLFACGSHSDLGRMKTDFKAIVAEHKAYGSEYICVAGIPREGGYTFDAANMRRLVRDLSDMAKRMRDAGLKLHYHNHSHEFARLDGATRMMDMLIDEASPELMLEIDIAWAHNAGADPFALLERVKGRCELVHVKDRRIVGRTQTSTVCDVGAGNMNWPGLIDCCRRLGIRVATVEIDDGWPVSPMESARVSAAYLKTLGVGLK